METASPPSPATEGKEKGKINLTPASYAGVAAAAANIQQAPALPRQGNPLPTVTEVTVIRTGGHIDPQTEIQIRARAADAIVREVRAKMAKVVAKPIPLRAGRWSIHPRSKGNFVYSFDGHIPFEIIASYEHILMEPFHGSGQLRPSLGWTRLLAHGVPIVDDDYTAFGPDALLKEVRTMPGLKKVSFAMPPRWLRPVDHLNASYSTITFAISDPDGSITNTLLKNRPALFGKEATTKRLEAAPWAETRSNATDAEEHTAPTNMTKYAPESTPQRGSVTVTTTTRALFRPRATRRADKARNRGRTNSTGPEPEQPAAPSATIEEVLDPDDDLTNPPPLPPNPSGPQVRAALNRRAAAGIYDATVHTMEVDTSPTYRPMDPAKITGWGEPDPEIQAKLYSPSRPQTGAGPVSLA
ncbi:hypothetical protein BJV78DRAFT_1285260 [Lactifluus subvellereus]|nr:hypothetical protein BJV78DRAFT_1285260 [Lactifluus subvellereus]